jgi:hypothetical protein
MCCKEKNVSDIISILLATSLCTHASVYLKAREVPTLVGALSLIALADQSVAVLPGILSLLWDHNHENGENLLYL